MTKFKVGDRVQRVGDFHWASGMQVGQTGTVAAIDGDAYMLSGFRGWHDEDYLKLDDTPPVDNSTSEADPNGIPANTPGAKLDAGKLRPTLVLRDMARALTAVVKIASDGAVKYTAGGWLQVPNGIERYEDAHFRHMLTRFAGKPVDDLSGSLHLAHEAWNALAKLELALREEERNAPSVPQT